MFTTSNNNSNMLSNFQQQPHHHHEQLMIGNSLGALTPSNLTIPSLYSQATTVSVTADQHSQLSSMPFSQQSIMRETLNFDYSKGIIDQQLYHQHLQFPSVSKKSYLYQNPLTATFENLKSTKNMNFQNSSFLKTTSHQTLKVQNSAMNTESSSLLTIYDNQSVLNRDFESQNQELNHNHSCNYEHAQTYYFQQRGIEIITRTHPRRLMSIKSFKDTDKVEIKSQNDSTDYKLKANTLEQELLHAHLKRKHRAKKLYLAQHHFPRKYLRKGMLKVLRQDNQNDLLYFEDKLIQHQNETIQLKTLDQKLEGLAGQFYSKQQHQVKSVVKSQNFSQNCCAKRTSKDQQQFSNNKQNKALNTINNQNQSQIQRQALHQALDSINKQQNQITSHEQISSNQDNSSFTSKLQKENKNFSDNQISIRSKPISKYPKKSSVLPRSLQVLHSHAKRSFQKLSESQYACIEDSVLLIPLLTKNNLSSNKNLKQKCIQQAEQLKQEEELERLRVIHYEGINKESAGFQLCNQVECDQKEILLRRFEDQCTKNKREKQAAVDQQQSNQSCNSIQVEQQSEAMIRMSTQMAQNNQQIPQLTIMQNQRQNMEVTQRVQIGTPSDEESQDLNRSSASQINHHSSSFSCIDDLNSVSYSQLSSQTVIRPFAFINNSVDSNSCDDDRSNDLQDDEDDYDYFE